MRIPLVLAAALALCLNASAARDATTPPPAAWATYGDSAGRAGDGPAAPGMLARDFVLPLPGRIVGQVLSANGDFYAATTAGEVAAFTADGFPLWHVDVGQLANTCRQLDGYGIVGTGVIDTAAGTLYVADAFGRLHALDLATGAERAGWPVRVYSDISRELVWGALTLADGSVYVPTASYCDSPSLGGVYRVDLASGAVTRWVSVPQEDGGGGGVWGWGGTAYSPADDALYAVTANAFSGGDNTGDAFSESAGDGEHVVELAPDLSVSGDDHPGDLTTPADLDFVGSPVVVDRAGCGELVVGADKDDVVYAWKGGDLAAGPLWELPLQDFDPDDPMLSQLAWSSGLDSLYAVTGTQLVRVAVGADCTPHVDWREPLGTKTENGSPTVAGDTVWFAANGTPTLYGYDARTGIRVFDAPLGGTTVDAPTVDDGRLVVGTMTGLVEGFSYGTAADPRATARATSWATADRGWQARARGVYATEDAGRTWHRVYAGPTLAAVRVSRTMGFVSVGVGPGLCMCTTRQLYTNDGGQTWHETASLPETFAAGGGRLYFWAGGRLGVVGSLSRHTSSSRLATATLTSIADGTIVQVEAIPGGVAALVSSRVNGQGWDSAPRVLLVHGTSVQTVTLPATRGRFLAQSLDVAWPKLTVDAADFVANPVRAAAWVSPDGGATWSLGA